MGMSIMLEGEEVLSSDRTREQIERLLLALNLSPSLKLGKKVPPPDYQYFAESLGSYANISFFIRYADCIEQSGAPPDSPIRDREGNSKAAARLLKNPSSQFPHLLKPWFGNTYYLPLDFEKPIVGLHSKGMKRIFGNQPCSAGSSSNLLAELDHLNKYLEMPGDMGELGVEATEEATEDDPWSVEKQLWALFRWFARESINQKGVITFS